MYPNVCLSSAYMAPVAYYIRLFHADKVLIEQHEHYIKQTYRNRCEIDSPNGILALTIPTELRLGSKTPMKEVRISSHNNWRHTHWTALVSSYENSPYFEYYADDLRPFYEQKYEFLLDFSLALQEKICSLLDFSPATELTKEYLTPKTMGDTLDLRESLQPKTLRAGGDSIKPKKYYQVFASRHGFLENLSIADLLFNMGPESLITLRDSI